MTYQTLHTPPITLEEPGCSEDEPLKKFYALKYNLCLIFFLIVLDDRRGNLSEVETR